MDNKTEEKLPYCTTAPSGEHSRAGGDDEPCDDGRAGEVNQKGGKTIHEKKELCDKIRSLYPEIGECGIDIDVEWAEKKRVWVVDLKRDEHELRTHLEPDDADGCIEGKQCVSLGLQIAQLKANIEKA